MASLGHNELRFVFTNHPFIHDLHKSLTYRNTHHEIYTVHVLTFGAKLDSYHEMYTALTFRVKLDTLREMYTALTFRAKLDSHHVIHSINSLRPSNAYMCRVH